MSEWLKYEKMHQVPTTQESPQRNLAEPEAQEIPDGCTEYLFDKFESAERSNNNVKLEE